MVRPLAGSSCACYNSASVEDVGVTSSGTDDQGCLQMDWYVARNSRNRGVAEGDWQESEMWASRGHLVRKNLERESASDVRAWRGDGANRNSSGAESKVGTGKPTWLFGQARIDEVCVQFTSCPSLGICKFLRVRMFSDIILRLSGHASQRNLPSHGTNKVLVLRNTVTS